eukprot:4728262-Lingulodinium_polyedra.AAC.1
MHSEVPGVLSTAYVDDRALRTYGRDALKLALSRTVELDGNTGHKLNLDKTNVASTTPAGHAWARNLKIEGQA